MVVQVSGPLVVADEVIRRGLFWGKDDQNRMAHMKMRGIPMSARVMAVANARLAARCRSIVEDDGEKGTSTEGVVGEGEKGERGEVLSRAP